MTENREDKTPEEVTLKMKLEDVLGVVAKSGNRPILTGMSPHDADSEDIKKAWFRHVLSSMERLGGLIETIRGVDIINLKNDLKEDIRRAEARLDRLEQQARDNRQELLSKIDKVDTELTAKIERSYQDLLKRIDDVTRELNNYKTIIDNKFLQFEKDLTDYKSTVVDPLRLKVLSISVKIGVWATIAGIVGSGLFAAAGYIIKTYVLK